MTETPEFSPHSAAEVASAPESTVPRPSSMPASSVTGDLRLHQLSSGIVGNQRMLRVWLPPGYDAPENSSRSYPVFYLNDGQNLFDRATAFGGVEWGVDETADLLIRANEVQPLIIVGIDNTGRNRIREYLPYRAMNPPVLRPQGKRYPNFLIQEVMPFVQQRYRIAGGPDNTGLGGSSLGAIISLFTVLDRPGLFGRLLLESPSLFVSNRKLLKYSYAFRRWPQKIYLAMGTNEAGNPERSQAVVDDVRALERIMRHEGMGPDRLRVNIEQGATHNEAAWGHRFPDALRFLFGV